MCASQCFRAFYVLNHLNLWRFYNKHFSNPHFHMRKLKHRNFKTFAPKPLTSRRSILDLNISSTIDESFSYSQLSAASISILMVAIESNSSDDLLIAGSWGLQPLLYEVNTEWIQALRGYKSDHFPPRPCTLGSRWGLGPRNTPLNPVKVIRRLNWIRLE